MITWVGFTGGGAAAGGVHAGLERQHFDVLQEHLLARHVCVLLGVATTKCDDMSVICIDHACI